MSPTLHVMGFGDLLGDRDPAALAQARGRRSRLPSWIWLAGIGVGVLASARDDPNAAPGEIEEAALVGTHPATPGRAAMRAGRRRGEAAGGKVVVAVSRPTRRL